jgi:RHS repeat-associated protein
LAALSTDRDGASLSGRAPTGHHWTATTSTVDALGRTICTLSRNGPVAERDWHVVRTTYDLRGNTLAVVDQLARTTVRYDYDLLDRPLAVDSIDSGRRLALPDAAGNAVATRDARGCVALRRFDALHRLVELRARDDADARLTLRERIVHGDSLPPGPERDAAVAGNALGRVWRHDDEAGAVAFPAYDFAGRVLRSERYVVSDAAVAAAEPAGWTADWDAADAGADLEPAAHTTSSRYDALGRAVEVRPPADVEGHVATVVPSYSRSGALQSVTVDGTPYVRQVAHDAKGQRVLIAYGNGAASGEGPGVVTRYAYDPASGELVRMRSQTMDPQADGWTGAGSLLQDTTYSYDLVGNPTAVEERSSGCGIAGTADGRDVLVRRLEYDPCYRLTSATGRACSDIPAPRPAVDLPRCGAGATPGPGNAPDLTSSCREDYTYDPLGNLLGLRFSTLAGGSAWHRRFGLGHRPASEWAQATDNRTTSVTTGSGSTSPITYDAAGNVMTQGGGRTFTWDWAGRLRSFVVSAGAGVSVASRYLYGADGSRVKKWVRRGASEVLDESTTYVGGLVEHHRWSKSGGGRSSGLHVADGHRRVARLHVGDRHPDGGEPATYELADHLGSSTIALGATGLWMNREEYFPYGETSLGSYARKRYRYAGKERDEESGLYHYGVRYYAPWLGRWMSCDPVPPVPPGRQTVPRAGAVRPLSSYLYGRSSPLAFVDPTGGVEVKATSELKAGIGPVKLSGKASERFGGTTSGGEAAASAGVEQSLGPLKAGGSVDTTGTVKGKASLDGVEGEASADPKKAGKGLEVAVPLGSVKVKIKVSGEGHISAGITAGVPGAEAGGSGTFKALDNSDLHSLGTVTSEGELTFQAGLSKAQGSGKLEAVFTEHSVRFMEATDRALRQIGAARREASGIPETSQKIEVRDWKPEDPEEDTRSWWQKFTEGVRAFGRVWSDIGKITDNDPRTGEQVDPATGRPYEDRSQLDYH